MKFRKYSIFNYFNEITCCYSKKKIKNINMLFIFFKNFHIFIYIVKKITKTFLVSNFFYF